MALQSVAYAQNAQAQPAPEENPPEKTVTLDEIVVTANKLEQSILDVPYSLSAVSGDALEAMGASEYRDYLTAVPGVALVDRGQNNNNVIIRGLASAPDGDGGGGTVVTYFDELALDGGPGAIEIEPVDLERVEVLRGPQGTLYGAGSIAGTLRIIPRRPDLTAFGGEAEVTGFTQRGAGGKIGFDTHAVLNVPIITDTLAVRAVGFYREDLPYTNNLELNRRVGDSERFGGRITLLARPTPDLDIVLQYAGQRDDGNGNRAQEFGLAPRTVRRAEESGDRDLDLYNANIRYDFGSVTFDAVVGYVESRSRAVGDASLLTPFFFPGENLLSRARNEGSGFTAEMRFASQNSGRFQWLIGGYYQKEDSKADGFVFEPSSGDEFSFGSSTSESTQKAIFGHLSIPILTEVTFDIGARYSDFEVVNVSTTGAPITTRSKESVFTPRFNLRYEPTDKQLYYVQVAKGFRPGGPNSEPPPTCATLPGLDQFRSFSSDSLWSYEAGGKVSLADSRVEISAAAYYSDWKNIPVFVNVVDLALNCFFTPFQNAGNARSVGVEGEVRIAPTDGLVLSLGGSYTDAKLTSDTRGFQVGQRLPASPQVLLNFGANYERPLSGSLQGYIGGNVNYVGSYPNYLIEDGQSLITNFAIDTRFGITEDPGAGGYVIANLHLGVRTDTWDVSLYARNLFNADTPTTVNLISLAGAPTSSYLQPRVIGATARVRF